MYIHTYACYQFVCSIDVSLIIQVLPLSMFANSVFTLGIPVICHSQFGGISVMLGLCTPQRHSESSPSFQKTVLGETAP